MPSLRLRPVTSLLLSWLLAISPVLAQTPQQDPKNQKPDPHALVQPDPKLAKKFAELAAKEEAAGAFEAALEDYETAARYAPFDVTLVSNAAALRARLVKGYVDAAEQLTLEGNFAGATRLLAGALWIDPNSPAVISRMQQLEAMGSPSEEFHELPAQGVPKLETMKVTKSFNLRTDVKNAYEQVAVAFGIKAAFDPDLPSRNVQFRLENVDFNTVMKVLTAETGTFWRTLNPKLIFVAADTNEKRKAYEMEIEETFPLTSSVDPSEMTEIVRMLREMTGIQHIQQSGPAHTVTIRDTEAKVKLAGEILRQVQHARGEVLLEVDILEVDRTKASLLGITPPTNLQLYYVPPALANSLRSAPDLTSLLTLLASIFGGPAGAAAASGVNSLIASIPPVTAIGGGKSTYLLSLPSASANFSDALSLVHSGRQVLLRAEDGKPATFFVGDRYPITLSLLSGSLGTTGLTPNPGGTGVTIPTQQFNVGTGPVALVTADFRNASLQDLAVVNQVDNSLTILLNQGTGAFSQFAQPTTGLGIVSPIALGTKWTSTTSPPPSLATGSLNTLSTSPNNDSFADLLVADPVGNDVIVLLGQGDGSFKTLGTPIPVGNQPSAIAVGTFNTSTDSNLGFVVTNFTDNTYSVFNGKGDGTFTPAPGSPFTFPTPNNEKGPYAITVADFNGDGISDLAIVNQTTNNVTVLEGKGNGTFQEFPNSPIAVGALPVAISSGNITSSTGPALAVINQADNTLTVLLGNGDGTFLTSSQSPIATGATPSGVVIGTFLEGSSGIAVSNRDNGTVSVFLDLGSGLFTNAVEPAAGTDPGAILAGGFTNSTFPDIVVANNIPDAVGQVTLIVSPTSLLSNAGIAQQPYPGSEYEDIGLKVKATPSVHDNGEVTLQLEFEIKALSGANVNGIPVISNRTVTQTVRLRENETSLASGLLDKEESKTITGIPGLAGLPGIGYAFGTRDNSLTDEELLILITPRNLRLPVHSTRVIYAGRGDLSGRGGVGASAPPPRPDNGREEPTPQPQPQPGTEPAAPQPQPQPQPQPGIEQPAPAQTPAPAPAPTDQPPLQAPETPPPQ
jgi:Flp pilus assembly secretin CpaC